MGTDGQNLKETAALYDLTEAEQELLLARKRGHALFLVGAKRLHIHFEIPDYKMAYMGKAGGPATAALSGQSSGTPHRRSEAPFLPGSGSSAPSARSAG